MPGEILTIQAGQCGNQIGSGFWSQLCKEHGIDQAGEPSNRSDSDQIRDDQPEIFFSKNDDNRYTPRAILVDMEPRVVGNIVQQLPMFNPRNVHLASNGGGAGNIWAQGYEYGAQHQEELIEMLDKNLDNCDSLEGFQLIHSVAGGTGSGVGSKILEILSDRYSKKVTTTFSVFPEMDETSDVVVQPYNTVLTLKRLIENSDANVVFDNSLLANLLSINLQTLNPSFEETNQLISTVMSGMTNTLRFPSYSYSTMTSILLNLVPTPDLHFLIPTYTPFTSDFVSHARDIRKSTLYDVILELLDKKLRMVKLDGGLNISVMDFIQGDIEHADIQKLLIKAQQRVKFVPWTTSSLHLAILKQPPFFKNKKTVNGLQLSNNTSIVTLLQKITSQYDKLMRRQLFVESYKRYDDIIEEFNDSRDMVDSLIDEYRRSESMSYLEDDDEQMEEL